MNESTATDISEAFLEMREAFGVPATIGETALTVIASEAQFGRELSDGGFAENGDVDLKYLLSDLEEQPSIGVTVLYRARTFRVKEIGTHPTALVGELTIRPSKR